MLAVSELAKSQRASLKDDAIKSFPTLLDGEGERTCCVVHLAWGITRG